MITSQEFLASLSPMAQKLMTIYQFKESKPLRLTITANEDKPCFMVFDNPDCYPVYINPEALGKKAEMYFIHQFCHCVQMDSDFPYVKEKDRNDTEAAQLAMALNSLVLDRYVHSIFKSNGYPLDIDALDKRYTELYCRIRYWNENNTDLKTLDKKYLEYIYATQIASIYFDLDTKKARGLQKLAAPVSKEIKQYAGMCISIIKSYAYNTNIGCHYIFEKLVEDLKLSDILYVEHQELFPDDKSENPSLTNTNE